MNLQNGNCFLLNEQNVTFWVIFPSQAARQTARFIVGSPRLVTNPLLRLDHVKCLVSAIGVFVALS